MGSSSPFKLKRISPQLLVTNMNLSVGFYNGKLGFDIEFRYEDFYTGMIKDGCSIHLKSGSPSVEERMRKRNNEDLDIVFLVDDIAALYAEMLHKDIVPIMPLRNMPYGKEIYIEDPDGYIIGFIEQA